MSAITQFERDAIMGMCQQRIPLGVQARSLKISRENVRRAAIEFLATGEIAELTADDIRNGHHFSWAEELLPEASEVRRVPLSSGVTCPCCGGVTGILSPNLIARACELPPQQEAILSRVWQGKGKPVTGETLIAAMYADDFDGGPEYETARKYFKTQLCLLRKSIERTGVRIEAVGYQRGYRLVLGQAEAPREIKPRQTAVDSSIPIHIIVATEAPAEPHPIAPHLDVHEAPKALKASVPKKPRKPREKASPPNSTTKIAGASTFKKMLPTAPSTVADGERLRLRHVKRSSLLNRRTARGQRISRFEAWK